MKRRIVTLQHVQARKFVILALVATAVVLAVPVLIVLSIVLMTVAQVVIPPLMVVALIVMAVRKRRMRNVARAFVCFTCGHRLGVAAVRLANRAWNQRMREIRRKYGERGGRIVRTLDAICATCGTRYAFVEHRHTFTLDSRPWVAVGA